MSADAVTSNQSAVGSTPTAVGARAATVENLKILNSPQEGGSKKEYEDFLDKSFDGTVNKTSPLAQIYMIS